MVKHLPKTIMAKPADFEKVWKDYTDEIGKVNIKAYEDRINDQIKWRIDNWTPKK
jgi:putative aldouronate transport system substrate-binding protein